MHDLEKKKIIPRKKKFCNGLSQPISIQAGASFSIDKSSSHFRNAHFRQYGCLHLDQKNILLLYKFIGIFNFTILKQNEQVNSCVRCCVMF